MDALQQGRGVLMEVHHLIKAIPREYALIGFCCFCAVLLPGLKHRYVVHYWATFMAGFGGGILCSLIAQTPKAPMALLTSNYFGLCWTLCWWAMNYFPFGVCRRLYFIWPLPGLARCCVALLRAQTIVKWVDLCALQLCPGVVVAALTLGTLAGSGGSMITDFVQDTWGTLEKPAEASVPTFTLRSAFLAALLQWSLAHHFKVLDPRESEALIVTLLVSQAVLVGVLGYDVTTVDLTKPVFRLLHTLTNIPEPTLSGPALAYQKRTAEAAATAAHQTGGAGQQGVSDPSAAAAAATAGRSGRSSVERGAVALAAQVPFKQQQQEPEGRHRKGDIGALSVVQPPSVGHQVHQRKGARGSAVSGSRS